MTLFEVRPIQWRPVARLSVPMSKLHEWHRPIFIVATVTFLFFLHFLYRNSLAVHWAYYGYASDLTVLRAVLAVLLLLVSAVLVRLSTNEFAKSLHTVFFFWLICPLAIFSAYNAHGLLLISGAFLFQAIFFLYDHFIPDNFRIASVLPGWSFFVVMLVLAGLACLALLRDFGLPFSLGALDVTGDEAEIRLHAREVGSTLSGYLSSLVGSVVAPVLIAYGIARRNLILIGLGTFLLVYIFFCYGSKVTLFSVVLILAFASSNWQLFRLKFALLNMGLVISALIFSIVNPFNMFLGLFINRMLMVPILNSSNYIDFFSQNGMTALSQSRLNPFYVYPYDQHPAFLIGSLYYDQDALSANVGYPGEAYMNFGFAGFIVVPVIISLFLIVLRNGRLSPYFAGLILLQFTNFTGSSFTTFIVTHGLLLLTLLVVAWPSKFSAAPGTG